MTLETRKQLVGGCCDGVEVPTGDAWSSYQICEHGVRYLRPAAWRAHIKTRATGPRVGDIQAIIPLIHPSVPEDVVGEPQEVEFQLGEP